MKMKSHRKSVRRTKKIRDQMKAQQLHVVLQCRATFQTRNLPCTVQPTTFIYGCMVSDILDAEFHFRLLVGRLRALTHCNTADDVTSTLHFSRVVHSITGAVVWLNL